MAAPALKAIIFDCFGVLVTGARSQLSEQHPEKAQDISDLNKQADLGYLAKKEYDEHLAKLLDIDPSQVDALLVPEVVRNEALLREIKQLRLQYKTAVLSNVGPEWFEKFFSPAEQEQLFDEVILSYHVGMVKPQPEIYQYAVRTLKVGMENCVFIDDIASNVEAAQSLGMRGIHYRNLTQVQKALASLLK